MKKCVCCNSSKMSEGIIQTADALKLVFLPKDQIKKIIPKSKRIQVLVCEDCGYISFFTSVEKP